MHKLNNIQPTIKNIAAKSMGFQLFWPLLQMIINWKKKLIGWHILCAILCHVKFLNLNLKSITVKEKRMVQPTVLQRFDFPWSWNYF